MSATSSLSAKFADSSVTPPPSPLEESLAKEIRRAADLTHNNLGDIGGYTVRSVPVEKDPTFQNDDESKSDETDHDPDNAPADILDQLSEFDKIDDTTIANDSETSEESQGKESGQNSDDEMTESVDTDHVSSGTKRKHSESSEPISTSRDQRNRAFADPLKKKKIEVEIVEFDD